RGGFDGPGGAAGTRLRTGPSNASARSFATRSPPAGPSAIPRGDLRGALAPLKVTNRAAITEPREVAQLLRAIHGYRGHPVVEAALQLAPLVFVRPGELRAENQVHG